METSKKYQRMQKAVDSFNKAKGSERVVLVGSHFRGPRSTYETFDILVDGKPDTFHPMCRETVKDYVTTMGYLIK